MQIPNFFIIGAPKCGTTSLAMYLKDHPQIFVTDPKEPHFFNTDFANRHTTSEREYREYFRAACPQHKAIGEASVFYMYSDIAVPNIMKYKPDARFIVMLRNPLDMAQSWHSQAVYSFGETVLNFEESWHLQSARKIGKNIPHCCRDVKVLLYGDICRIGYQLRRLYQRVPANKVHIIFLDDFKESPRKYYRQVLEFLKVEDDWREDFPAYNERKIPKLKHLELLYQSANHIKRLIRAEKGFGLMSRLRRMNTRCSPRFPLPKEFRAELVDYFRKDIVLLSELVNRDLTGWLTV